MIGRIWHGWTAPENADAYEALLKQYALDYRKVKELKLGLMSKVTNIALY